MKNIALVQQTPIGDIRPSPENDLIYRKTTRRDDALWDLANSIAQPGRNVWELDALTPKQLQTLLREAIESAMDMQAFARQQKIEREKLASLEASRRALAGIVGAS